MSLKIDKCVLQKTVAQQSVHLMGGTAALRAACGIFEHFSGFEFFLPSERIPAHPPQLTQTVSFVTLEK